MLRTLLIDDEPAARDDLREMLAAHAGVTVVGEAGLLSEARARLAHDDYQLVFLDVELRGGSGFDLAPLVRAGAAIVFVTGFERYAVRAFEVNALDYLVKPVTAERLDATLRRVVATLAAPAGDSAGHTLPALAPDDRVFLKDDRHARLAPLSAISAILSRENYTDVFLSNGERFFMRRTLKAWEEALPAANFVRVHRTALANLTQIEHIDGPESETPRLHLRGVPEPIACSHRLSPELRRRLAK